MSAHKINFYLSASERLQSLFTQAQYLIQLQQTFRKIVPANLAESCQVAAIDQKILVIFVDNGAVDAKLKHLLPETFKKTLRALRESLRSLCEIFALFA